LRDEYPIIIDWIPAGSTVIDLGCGFGKLMELLKAKHKNNIAIYGMDDNDACVSGCVKRGLNVVRGRIDEHLPYWENEFDFAICNVTLQMVLEPLGLLSNMFRMSNNQIISFPNFANYRNRFEMMFRGRMPQHALCGYKWHNTGHIHQLSIKDFENFVKDTGRQIVKKRFLPRRILPNLLTNVAIYWLR